MEARRVDLRVPDKFRSDLKDYAAEKDPVDQKALWDRGHLISSANRRSKTVLNSDSEESQETIGTPARGIADSCTNLVRFPRAARYANLVDERLDALGRRCSEPTHNGRDREVQHHAERPDSFR